MPPTTVVVPVYNAPAALERCLDALARWLPPATPVVIADDASPDPAVAAVLGRPWPDSFAIVRRTLNLGFVANVNRALAGRTGDFLLLNQDAELTSGAYQAILRAAASAPDVASVTPWSNNAEICSWPTFVSVNPRADSADALRAALDATPPQYPELPTAVGFCMWVSGQAWRRIGDFDAATYGRGYGEENDWCCRAAGFGYRHLLVDDAYVFHQGGQSFGPLGLAPNGEALRRLSTRYPDYQNQIAAFIAADPLAPLRQRLLDHYLRQGGQFA